MGFLKLMTFKDALLLQLLKDDYLSAQLENRKLALGIYE